MSIKDDKEKKQATKSIKIAVRSGESIGQQGLKLVLGEEPDFEVGDGWDGAAGQIEPDVLVIDPPMSSMNDGMLLKEVSENARKTNVVVLSPYTDEAHLYGVLKAGAKACVLKSGTVTELKQAIRAAVEGRRYLAQSVVDTILDAYLGREPGHLTRRQQEVMELIAQHLTSAQIAAQLHISQRTVEVYRSELHKKLGLSVRHSGGMLLAQRALQLGILSTKKDELQ